MDVQDNVPPIMNKSTSSACIINIQTFRTSSHCALSTWQWEGLWLSNLSQHKARSTPALSRSAHSFKGMRKPEILFLYDYPPTSLPGRNKASSLPLSHCIQSRWHGKPGGVTVLHNEFYRTYNPLKSTFLAILLLRAAIIVYRELSQHLLVWVEREIATHKAVRVVNGNGCCTFWWVRWHSLNTKCYTHSKDQSISNNTSVLPEAYLDNSYESEKQFCVAVHFTSQRYRLHRLPYTRAQDLPINYSYYFNVFYVPCNNHTHNM